MYINYEIGISSDSADLFVIFRVGDFIVIFVLFSGT